MPCESICGVSIFDFVMERGFYTDEKINFDSFIINKFIPYIYDPYIHSSVSCGCSTLALLTGISPFILSVLNKNKNHTSDKFMLDILKSNGFKIAKLTQCSVSNNTSRVLQNSIKYYHVLLVSQLVLKNEATWSVINDQYIYHNFLVNLLKPLEFLNRPPITAYLLFHKKYK